jgi:nucleoside-diphosphate-sugar epimerase
VLLDLADRPETYGRWWHLGGPGTITQREFATKVFAAAGKTLKIRVAGKTTLRLMGLFSPMMRELVEMSYLHTTPVVLDDTALQKLLGPLKKTSYDEGIRKTLEAMRASPAARAA